ncbi:hypothetical protein C9374_009313 [Naegleria lovaniensis]|uniref:Tr-type G domain-containing protein n=1 Tax=Naegleria lovaniensis TaxID=51637 RepID=A0AA88GHC5_NAELO|nr:uncharacterized protein C9374_009313 [Naegleria lovaniensis]KAG2377402.1 hypothetical protein C9374_009313 [Naegleria lovaniensis]
MLKRYLAPSPSSFLCSSKHNMLSSLGTASSTILRTSCSRPMTIMRSKTNHFMFPMNTTTSTCKREYSDHSEKKASSSLKHTTRQKDIKSNTQDSGDTLGNIMFELPSHMIRNVGIIAHIDAGKTTTTERMLYYSGYSSHLGNVDDGDTITDYMPQEQERGITITSAAITFKWKDHRINLIDTPGHVDFTFEVERSVSVLDGAVAIFDVVNGVEAQSKTVWRQADRYNVPRIVYMNKMDKIGANFEFAISTLLERLPGCPTPIPVQLPNGTEDAFTSVFDLIEIKEYKFSGDESREYKPLEVQPKDLDRVMKAREEMIDKIASIDEDLGEKYLNEEEITPNDIHNALRRITISRKAIPIFCGSSLKNKGVQQVLDGVIRYLPGPKIDEKHKELNAFAFKVINDAQRGLLVFVRVYGGAIDITKSPAIFNHSKNQKERIGKIYQMHANVPQEVKKISSGNIGVLVGLRETGTGDILVAKHGAKLDTAIPQLSVPKPVFFCSIEAENSAEQEALDNALSILQKEDSSLKITNNEETNQTLVSGMGELHLEIIKDRILTEYGINVEMGEVQISYRETLTVESPVTFLEFDKKLTTGKRLYAKLWLKVGPSESGQGNVVNFEWDEDLCLPDQKVIKKFEKSIRYGIESSFMRGALLGYPIEEMTVTVVGASILDDNNEQIISGNEELQNQSFIGCAHTLFNKVLKENEQHIRLLEPYMDIEIETDRTYIGSIMSDLTGSRRGKIKGLQSKLEHFTIICAEVPLSEMIGYSSHLRSLTSGQCHYHMDFARYEPLQQEYQKKLITKIRGY